MTIYEELVARGLIAQVTNEDEIKSMIIHENHDTPAAKMYWDEERELWILHCFGECHRNFTAYDYVKLILCEKYQRYSSPLHFLKINIPEYKLGMQLELYQENMSVITFSPVSICIARYWS